VEVLWSCDFILGNLLTNSAGITSCTTIDGKHVSVQVKTSRGSYWQFGNITQFCNISFNGKRQIVAKPKQCPVRRLVVVFVMVGANCPDQYFILTWRRLRKIIVKGHKAYLKKHGGQRPQRWDSLHCAISEEELRRYKDNWIIIERNLL
jgi:hypothetical protein